MVIPVNTNSHGFTLIEFLVAIVILMVGMLGLLQTVNYAIVHNMNNQLRQTALMVGDERMNMELSKPFDNISAPSSFDPPPANYSRSYADVRLVNGAQRTYTVVKNNSDLTSQTKNVEFIISWTYKNQQYSHSISSLVSKLK
jgi:type IV pilus assembly protein PilV